MDCTEVLKLVRSSDFVYLDPPYQPVSKTANFTGYTKDQFGWPDQMRLASELARMKDEVRCKILLSNSQTPEIESLYRRASFEITHVTAPRVISSDAASRGNMRELLIRNF